MVRVDGDVKGLMKKLKGLGSIDKKNLNLILAETMRESTVQRFKTQRSPEGKPWKKSIRAEQEGGVTLVKSARLRNSIKSEASVEGFAVGTNTIYGRTHQLGDKGRTIRAKTPKGLVFQVNGAWVHTQQVTIDIEPRPFLGMSDDDYHELINMVETTLQEVGR